MQQVLSLWRALTPVRRAVAIGAAVAVFAGVLAMARMAAQPGLALLYDGLDGAAAGEVVTALEGRGVPFEVRGDSIHVPASERDRLRMALAGEGLPATSGQGYELLDSLSGFGTTSQMFDAAYWRAKEGELARTIAASPGVSAARVHIANVGGRSFQRDLRPTASVAVTRRTGDVSADQAQALRHLVAGAVPDMDPEDVTVVDDGGELVTAGAETESDAGEDRTARLRERVLRLVEARVGHGNAVVEVALETVTEQETIRERRLDPDSRIAISTDTEERSSQAQESGGAVGVASNLPDGDAGGEDNRNSTDSRTRERVNFEVSETEREVLRAPGAIRRLTVAVLVGGTNAGDSQDFTPLPEDELESLRGLVASAVGFDAARGDEITIRSMPLAAAPAERGTTARSGWVDALALDTMRLVQLAVLALVILVLALFVLRPLLTRRPDVRDDTSDLLAGPARDTGPHATADAPAPAQALDGVIETGPFEPAQLPTVTGQDGTPEAPPVDRLRALIDERREETMEILSSWLDDEQERA